MNTDTILYEIFHTLPSLLFVLVGEEASKADGYTVASTEVKQAAFRLDGILLPPTPHQTLYFLEMQFQRDKRFYFRLFAEIFVYFRKTMPDFPWKAVVLFAKEAHDPGIPSVFNALLPHLHIIHLDKIPNDVFRKHPADILELLILPEDPLLVVEKAQEAIVRAKGIHATRGAETHDLITKVLYEKFQSLTFKEIETMLDAKWSTFENSTLHRTMKAHYEEQGLKKGLQQGVQQGSQQAMFKTALALLQEGSTVEFIQRVTGLSREQIEALRPQ
jgi:predicted transposase YdaD